VSVKRRPLKKVSQYDSILDFPLLSFKYDERKNTIYLRVLKPLSTLSSKRDVTGFIIKHTIYYRVEGVNGIDVSVWIKENDLKGLLGSEIHKILGHGTWLRNWFHNLARYEFDLDVVELVYYARSINFLVWVMLTVHFSEEIPYEDFAENFSNFIYESFTERGLFGRLEATVRRLITENFPTASVSTVSGFDEYMFLSSKDESPIEYIFGKLPPNYLFTDITIQLRSPLHEKVINSLLSSSNEREFVFKFLVLIDQSKVRSASISGPRGEWAEDVNFDKVRDLLVEVSSLVPK